MEAAGSYEMSVPTYLPNKTASHKTITLKQLLSHHLLLNNKSEHESFKNSHGIQHKPGVYQILYECRNVYLGRS
jgi:hypothetical protein